MDINKRHQLAVEELEHLPLSEALDGLVRDRAIDRSAIWTSDRPIAIDESRLPNVITDGFYIGAKSDLSDIKAEIKESMLGERPSWDFVMDFTVKSYFKYRIRANSESDIAIIETADSYENTTSLNIPVNEVVNFLLAIYFEQITQRDDQDEDISSKEPSRADILAMARNIEDMPYFVNDAIYKLLDMLADINGLMQSKTISEMPKTDNDHLVIITKHIKKTPRSESCDIEVELIENSKNEEDRSQKTRARVGSTLSADEANSKSNSYAEVSFLNCTSDTIRDLLRSGSLAIFEQDLTSPGIERFESDNKKFPSLANACIRAIAKHVRPYEFEHTIPLDVLGENDGPTIDPKYDV